MTTPLTTSLEDFQDQLQDGDILLFDKLTSLNRLVQWGDNRPVGHCGIWRSGKVYEATNKKPGDAESEGGVFRSVFADLMDLTVQDDRGARVSLVRTVTAMRHPDVTDDHRSALWAYLDDRVDSAMFAVMDAFLLTPFAIDRAYQGNDPLVEVLRGVTNACRSYARLRLGKQGGGQRMFCSKLVFGAFDAAGLRIEIREPLYDRYFTRGRGPSDITSELDEYREFFETEILTDELPARDTQPAGGRNTRPFRAARRGPTFADMVTPGDFWSSPSLDPVAALHRLP